MILPTIVVGVLVGTLLCSPCLAQETWEAAGLEQLKQAEKHLKQAEQEYDAALDICKEVIKSHPDLEARARLFMAKIHLKQDKWNAAALESKNVVRKFPESTEALDALKLIYKAHITAGHPHGAEAWILPLIQSHLVPVGRGAEALERLANIYLGMREYDKTLATATRLINDYPDSSQVNKAVSYIFTVYNRQGGGEAALTRMREFITLHPKSYLASCAQYQIAGFYRRTKDRIRAIEELEKLVGEYPDSPLCARVQREIGELYFHEGKFERAIAEFTRALVPHPDDPKYRARVLRALAVSYVKNREYDKAIEVYEATLQIEGQAAHWYPFAESFIAYCYERKGDYDRAIELYQASIAKYPSLPSHQAKGHYRIGYIYFIRGKHVEALAEFNKILQNYPDSKWVPLAQDQISGITRNLLKSAK